MEMFLYRNRRNNSHRSMLAIGRNVGFNKRLRFEPLEDRTLLSIYYIDGTNGNDNHTAIQAQNINSPWQTIQKGATNAVAGDTCLIRAGDYRETVTIPNSGTSGAHVTFHAYNNETVTIAGAESITGWTYAGNNTYYANMPWTMGNPSTSTNQVFVNDVMKPLAQWPNPNQSTASYPWRNSSIANSPEWAYVDSVTYDGNNHAVLHDAALPSRPNDYWNDAKINIMSGQGWYMQTWTVLDYDDSTKSLTVDHTYWNNNAYDPAAGNQYYL
jgi:hypothetical protein